MNSSSSKKTSLSLRLLVQSPVLFVNVSFPLAMGLTQGRIHQENEKEKERILTVEYINTDDKMCQKEFDNFVVVILGRAGEEKSSPKLTSKGIDFVLFVLLRRRRVLRILNMSGLEAEGTFYGLMGKS